MPKRIFICATPQNMGNYAAALKEAGLEPIVGTGLPTAEGLTVEDFAGLLLPGGDDIDPALFGQENDGSRTIDRALDESQLAAADEFVKAKKPILGICKGCQVLNVYFGGTVIQNLEDNTYHQRRDGEDVCHPARATAGSWLERLYGDAPVQINSAHHQAVGRLGRGLAVSQISVGGTRRADGAQDGGHSGAAGADGGAGTVIEAMHHESLPILALQWHPERLTARWKAAHPQAQTAHADCVDGGAVFESFARLVDAPLVDSDPEQILSRTECFALDMDGTVYLGERWIDGAQEFLHRVREVGKRFVFLTNNSSKSPSVYVEKLRRMGLDVDGEQIVTSGQATCFYLKRHFPGKKVFLLGNEMLKAQFTQEGVRLEEEHPDVVVVGFDTSLDYAKMCKVCDFVRAGLPYLSTHPDYNCPTQTGFIPDAGAIQAFIRASALRYPDRIIGKPNADMMEYLVERVRLPKERLLVVGDRLYTDVAAGRRNGIRSMLVLSGEAGPQDVATALPTEKPDLIFSSVGAAAPYL